MTNNTSGPNTTQDVQGVVERPPEAERLIVLVAMDNCQLALEVERYIDGLLANAASEHEGRVRAEEALAITDLAKDMQAAKLAAERGALFLVKQRLAKAEAALSSSQARVEALMGAISWVQPPFVDETTSPEELRKRVAFLLADVTKATTPEGRS